jgi:hypothetical protein
LSSHYEPEGTYLDCQYPNYSLYFNGTEEYVNCGDPESLDISGDITVVAYIKTESTANYSTIVGKYDPDVDAGWEIVTINDGQNIFFGGRAGIDSYIEVHSPVTINDGNWHRVIARREGDQWTLNVDNVEISETHSNGSFSNDYPLAFGQCWYNMGLPETDSYDGYLDNVAIWDRALDDSEFSSLYALNFTPGDISGLVGYWDLNGNALDLSGNYNHGQIEGTSWSLSDFTIGCTDPIASNYDPDATYNQNNSCEYYEGDFYVAEENTSGLISIGSPERPYTLIQEALDNASEGQVIHVASGLYEENIMWPGTSGLKLYGENEDTTIIDGMGEGTVIEFVSAAVIDTEIKAVTIQNGFSMFYVSGLYILAEQVPIDASMVFPPTLPVKRTFSTVTCSARI